MTDELHAGPRECGIAQQVIGMDMGIDDIAHGQLADFPNRAIQRLPLTDTATRIDHGDATFADDEAQVCYLITFEHYRDTPRPNVDPGSDLHDIARR